MPKAPPTPTLSRIQETSEKSQVIGEFLEWLMCTKGMTICEWHNEQLGQYNGAFKLVPGTPHDLLREYFNIDPVAEAQEREALWAYIREF